MKHHLRKEKTCLNCGAHIPDRYCPHCGQENLEPRETVGHVVNHFFSDITHYDSKFLVTIRYLLFKPGFLTKEYLAGRRVSYLNPVRMYVFISAIFFIVLALRNKEAEIEPEEPAASHANAVRQHLADSLRQAIKPLSGRPDTYDSIKKQVVTDLASKLDTPVSKTGKEQAISFALGKEGFRFKLVDDRYNNVREYDSAQRLLPDSSRDKGFLRWVIRNNIDLKSRYGSRRQVVVGEDFQHNIPKLMFFLLPVFALLIAIFYSRKKYYYSQHLIFSIHFHSFIFLWLLIIKLLQSLIPYDPAEDILSVIFLLSSFIYLAIALGKVYEQSLPLSFVKAFFISLLYLVLLVAGIVSLAMFIFFTA